LISALQNIESAVQHGIPNLRAGRSPGIDPRSIPHFADARNDKEG
jgi:hypothetical protein